MGCTVRDKHTRTNRRTQSAKPEPDFNTTISLNCNVEKLGHANLGIKPKSDHIGLNGLTQDQNYIFDCNGLEEILLKNLDFLYNEALNRLVALGYCDDVALKALLSNGHCYGGMDVLTNVLYNSLVYLNGGISHEGENVDTFTDLRHLGEYSLAMMVCLLQQIKPHLSKGDALWCLLMSELHVGRASAIEIPVLPLSGRDVNGCGNTVPMSVGPTGVSPTLCRFHSGWGFGNNGMSEFRASGTNAFMREIECPKRFNLSPSMKSLLNRNVSMFAAGFKANLKHLHSQSRACSSGNLSHNDESHDLINSLMSKLCDLNLEEVALDQNDEMVLNLVHQIKELEKQVKERKEWAHQKAMQAARKVSHDLTELKTLRMERDEMCRLKKGKNMLDKSTMDRLDDMEEALRNASGQVDRSKGAVRKFEIEKAEIRAEIEASKLSASESISTCLEVAKREKKCLKKLLAWEKKSKMQEDIAKERRKIAELDEALVRVEADTKEAEEKWRDERKSKDLVLAHLHEERRLKEASEANNKRKLEALRLKIELDFQRHKDDFQCLEQEHTRLKESAKGTQIEHQYNDIWIDNTSPQRETIVRLLDELDQLEDCQDKEVMCGRECMICKKDEVSIVFLPCAHQVVCAKCNESYGKKGKAKCPCCRVPIEQRVRVYGASL